MGSHAPATVAPSRGSVHDRHRRHHRPRDPRQPRQSDGRGGRRAGGRRAAAARPCRRAPRPARTRRSSCATATRRAIGGKGVLKAVEAVNGEIFDALAGMDAEDQRRIDDALIELDGTPNKARLGANAILGVSLAVAKAAAQASGLPLYRYVGGVQRARAAGADDEHHQWRRACRQSDRHPGIHDHAGRRRKCAPKRCAWARRSSTRCSKAAERRGPQHQCRRRGRLRAEPEVGGGGAGLHRRRRSRRPATSPATDVVLALDCAVDRVLQGRQVRAWKARASTLDRRPAWRSISRISSRAIPIVSIEDGMAEDDWDGWKALTDAIGDKCQLVGDDLFVTNTKRLQHGHRERASPTRSWSRSTRSAR